MHVLNTNLGVWGPSPFLVLDTATITARDPRAIAAGPAQHLATTTAAIAHRPVNTTRLPVASTATTTQCPRTGVPAGARFRATTAGAAATTTTIAIVNQPAARAASDNTHQIDAGCEFLLMKQCWAIWCNGCSNAFYCSFLGDIEGLRQQRVAYLQRKFGQEKAAE